MKLTVVSHKEVWRDPASPSGFATYGGFPLQMQAISEGFDETVLAVPHFTGPPPPGLLPIQGHNLRVLTLRPSYGEGLRRQLAVVAHMPSLLPELWRALDDTDAVHAVVPGDIGTIGLAMALARKLPLFVRHCGTWGARRTPTERLLMYLLERHAGGRNVVMATGGAPEPPSTVNPAVQWIFSTSLRENEIQHVPQAAPWSPGQTLELVTVSRLDPGKNVGATLDALAVLRRDVPDVRFTVVGDGSMAEAWKAQAARLGLSDIVRFPGRVGHDDVLAILAKSHIFVFPTNVAEGFPKAVLEAMACGLPIIATRVSVIPELLRSRGGIVLPATTAADVERALRRLLAEPEALPAMGAAARAASLGYTLERWRDTIAERCGRAWGTPTRTDGAGAGPGIER
jgi:glycosyltransferase involved in cell wall biosynthesis